MASRFQIVDVEYIEELSKNENTEKNQELEARFQKMTG